MELETLLRSADMISIYATPDGRQVHISFDEREPLPQAPLVLVECFEDSQREEARSLVTMLGDPSGTPPERPPARA